MNEKRVAGRNVAVMFSVDAKSASIILMRPVGLHMFS
jgi:hypothetical protein